MKRFLLLLTLAVLTAAAPVRAEHTFAIVVDSVSLQQARAELQRYADAIHSVNGWRVVTVTDRWGTPDSIRVRLESLWKDSKAPLTGAVFVGDIPIPMIRDAQYLTSAFKIDQKRPWKESSVPSDRFYDDFHLKFKPLGKDDDAPYFYYSLTPESAQLLRPSIFSGRIRPTDAGGTSRYDKLRNYLRKAVAEKLAANRPDHLFYYTGHGSLSESLVAHIDEKRGLFEHFPALLNLSDPIGYMDYSDRPYIKEHLMNELMRPELDIALLHHHGDWDTQYLDAGPKPRSAYEAQEFLLRSCRQRIRQSNRPDSLAAVFCARYALADTAFANLNRPDIVRADSLAEALINLTLPDFAAYGFAPSCRVVVFDACYNGSFHCEDCIANEYIFGSGQTVACIGGSVNVLQDKWYDRYLGLLGEGVCVGRINQYNTYLESHVIGDPTFCFASWNQVPGLARMLDAPEKAAWKRYLKSPLADAQCMAMEQLFRQGRMTTDALLDRLRHSPFATVRLQAFTLLEATGGDAYVEAVKTAAADNYEMLQRFAVNGIRFSGHPSLVPSLIRLLAANNTSARSAFNASQALQFFPEDALLQEWRRVFASDSLRRTGKAKLGADMERQICSKAQTWPEDIEKLCSNGMSAKAALRQADYMRIYLPHDYLPKVAAYAKQVADPELKVALLHTLGWHRLSWKAQEVREAILPLTTDPSQPEAVRAEALRTYNRLK